jgi:hypothetical protein
MRIREAQKHKDPDADPNANPDPQHWVGTVMSNHLKRGLDICDPFFKNDLVPSEIQIC